MSEGENSRRIYCNRCRGETRHHLVASHPYHTDVEDGEYILWVCAGCDTGTMEDSYSAEYLDNPDEIQSIFYPDRAEHSRTQKHFMNLPRKLENLYREVVSAYNSNLQVLCAVGLRGLIEGVCADKAIQGHNLDQKIEAMKALLPENIVRNLHGFRFMGNRAAHELEAPSSGELRVATDLIEDILNYLYDLDYKARIFAGLTSAQKKNP